MPTFNTIAERDAYYANKLKNAGVAPAINPPSSAVNAAQTARAPVIPAVTPAPAPAAAEQGSWITTRPTATPAPAAATQAPVQLDIPKPEPTVIEKTVTASIDNTDKDAAAKAQVQGDYYKLWQQGEADVKAGIYKTNPYPANYSDYRAQQSAQGQQNVDFNKAQTDIANKLDQSGLQQQTSQGQSAIAGVNAAMAQSREGVMGTSKPLAASGFDARTTQVLNDAATRVNSSIAQRDQAQLNLENAQRTNESKSAEIYAGQVANANKEIAAAQTALADSQTKATSTALDFINKLDLGTGALSDADIQAISTATGADPTIIKIAAKSASNKNITTEAKAQMDNLSTFTDMASKGVSFNMTSLQSISQSTGLDVGTLANISQLGAQVAATKGIEQQKAQADLVSAIAEAGQKQRGIFTVAQQNIDGLQNLRIAGASPEIISAYKSAASITDVNDPKYKADLQYKQAEAAIEQAHAEGRAITPEDIVKFASAQEEMAYNNGAGAYPTPGGEDLASVALSYKTDGSWKQDFKNNPVYQGGTLGCAVVASGILKQAGVLDKKYPSIATLVPALVDKGWTRVDVPQKGDVVVWGLMQGTDGHGHVGVCTDGKNAVNNQGPSGPANTPIFYGRPVKPSDAYPLAGFYRPPASAQVGSNPTSIPLYTKTMNDAKAAGAPFAVAKKLAETAVTDAFTKQTQEAEANQPLSSDLEIIANKVSSYDINPSELSSRMPKGATESEKTKVLARAAEIKPSFSQSDYANRASLKKSLTSGALADNVRSINTLVAHLDNLSQAEEKLAPGGIPLLNKAWQTGAGAVGNANVNNFNVAKQAVSAELGKVFKGSGVVPEGEIKAWEDNFDAASSKEQINAAIQQGVQLMAGRLGAIKDQYSMTMGEPMSRGILSTESKAILKKLGIDPSNIESEDTTQQSTSGANTVNPFANMFQGFQSLVQRHNDTTGKWTTPEDHPVTKIKF